ncbi:hypothetical protein ACQY0O_005612 [Thecaphora frezii]
MLPSLFQTTLLALVATKAAVAHFTLDYPTTRGFNEDIEDDNFCGGFHNQTVPRSPWYYKNGPVEIDSHHDSATVNIYLSLEQTPSGPQSFLKTASGADIPPLRHDLVLSGAGEFCFHANASALSIDGVTIGDGTNATIMVEFISMTHGHLYQCSDVTFTSDASVGSNLTCTDSLKSSAAAASSSSSAAPAASSAPATTTSNKENAAASLASLPLAGSVAVAMAVAALGSALAVVG